MTSIILFTFGEMSILHGDSLALKGWERPKNFKIRAIVAERIAESDRQIAKARDVRPIGDRGYDGIQKIGEPDWNQVRRDAERKLGRKLLGEES